MDWAWTLALALLGRFGGAPAAAEACQPPNSSLSSNSASSA
jgi:hypothetical protein